MRTDYRDLISGNKARVIVDQNGERVEFTAANAPRLYALIQEAEACLNPSTPTRAHRPMGFYF
jgi:hypothetical protein